MKWFKSLFKEKYPIRYWDFSNAMKFYKLYKNELDYMALEMYNDANVCPEIFLENGFVVNGFNGRYQMYYTEIDGIRCTAGGIPCLHIIYKGGSEEYIACYVDVNDIENYGFSHRKLPNL